MMGLFKLKLSKREKITFRLHLLYSILEGIVLGVLALNEFVFIKSLQGKPYQLAFLFQFSMLVFLLSPIVNHYLGSHKSIRKVIRFTVVFTRLPLIVFLFFPDTVFSDNQWLRLIFLSVFFLYYLANPVIYPNINTFLKNSYQHQNFGVLYSMSTSVNKIIMLIVTFAYGIMLDVNPMVFKYVLPAVGVLTIISSFLLTLIPFKLKPEPFLEKRNNSVFLHGLKDSFVTIFKNLKENKEFLSFQIAFMFYGLAFMIGTPATNLFYKDILDLNYSSVAFYRNIYNVVAIMILPYMGNMLGKIGPMRFGVVTFGSLLFYFVFVTLSGLLPYHFTVFNIKIFHVMIIALIFHGVFASTMSLLWNIGSAYFGKNEQAGSYQNTHLFLTGVRAIPAPIIGIWLFETWGFVACFGISVLLLIGGIIVIKKTLKKENISNSA